MAAWRMSLRQGNRGPSLWRKCREFGVAAIFYPSLAKTDLARHPEGQPTEKWDDLAPTQKASLARVAYEMKGGDLIYVREGPKIVGRGIVVGSHKQKAYKFDWRFRLRDTNGTPWPHQVRVAWGPEIYVPNVVGRDQVTVKPLAVDEVDRLEKSIRKFRRKILHTRHKEDSHSELLKEESYYRETSARQNKIIPLHNKLSNDFRKWLYEEHFIGAGQEQQRVDIRFRHRNQIIVAELKVCRGVGPRKSIREALGQLLEYNYYPARDSADSWLIVLDRPPSDTDRNFIDILREERDLPLTVGWRRAGTFSFYPAWP
jgi:hypothetical protein